MVQVWPVLVAERSNDRSARNRWQLAMAYKSASWGLREDLARATQLFRDAAELGFGPAQAQLAHQLCYALDGTRDIEEAKRWATLALQSQHPFAVGFCYNFGHVVPRDHATARLYYLEAAREDFPQAYSGLILVCSDPEERLQYLRRVRHHLNMGF